ncbi:MAG: tetratricopeptide repeat protein [Spirochaetota bacterium]
MRRKGCSSLIIILLSSIVFIGAVNPAIELYQEGQQRLNRGNLFGAIDLFKEALSYNPDYAQPLFGLGQAYFKLEEYEQALVYVQRARLLDRNNSSIAALEGRVHTGLGRYEAAERIFESILNREPYNLEAQFGLAELHAATGNVENAISAYQNALESDPYNRRGLLSVALLYAAQNNLTEAAELIQTAVDSYPEDSRVHSIAAEYYFKSDEIRRAEQHARQALQLDEESEDALYVLIRILFSQGRYSDAVDIVDKNIKIDRNDPLLWYLRANALWNTGAEQRAIDSFYTALSLQPSAEISRIALEEFLLERYVPDSDERKRVADVRFEYGQAYERDNRIELARQEYRRGLMLNPYSREGRVMYAATFKRSNNIGKYLSILEVLAEENRTNQEIRDEIEIYRSLREDSVARSWDVDQFAIDRYRYRFALFTDSANSRMIHLQAQNNLTSYMQGILQGSEHIEIVSTDEIKSFADAFRQARETDVDFFIILTFNEGERAFKARASVYNGSTGAVIRNFESLRTGNRRVSQALIRIAANLSEALPLQGRIYRREDDTVLLDVGSFQGVAPEDTFEVIRSENLELSDTKFSLEYAESDILGQVEISQVDDLLAVGQVDTDQFFDLVNTGDAVIPVQPEENEGTGTEATANEAEVPIIPSEIYKSLLEIE